MGRLARLLVLAGAALPACVPVAEPSVDPAPARGVDGAGQEDAEVGEPAVPADSPSPPTVVVDPAWGAVEAIVPGMPAPPGSVRMATETRSPPFEMGLDGELSVLFAAWRASLEAAGFTVQVRQSDPGYVAVDLARGAVRGNLRLSGDQGYVHGVLDWTAAPREASFSSPCEPIPTPTFRVSVQSREANPPPDREDPVTRQWGFSTLYLVDVDRDGRFDAFVPDVGGRSCPYEVAYDVYVSRGACGHRVGRTVGLPALLATETAGLRDLLVTREYATITDPAAPWGPSNVATLHHVETRYVYRGGVYQAEPEQRRDGTCHHCGMASCRRLDP